MGRPLEQHIDNSELNALVPTSARSSPAKGEPEPRALSSDAVRDAERHVAACADCARKVAQYRQFVHQLSNAVVSETTPRTAACPREEDVDWHEVTAGLWPELKAAQLIQHAALCDHCGPLLRAATSVDPTPQEEKLLSELKAPSRPELIPAPASPSQQRWPVIRWIVPALALLLIAGVFMAMPRSSSPTQLSRNFAEFAVRTHRQHVQGNLALDVRSESQQTVNAWFQEKLPFALALPASLEAPGEQRPTRLEGARLVQVGGKAAAYIAYQMQSGPVSLMVTPNSVAVASGGVEVNFKKVSFHYGMVEGYRVVTWSLHGLTYALVSQESNTTQQSCMVCHSAMRDRDLSQTPPPLLAEGNAVAPTL